MNEDFMNDDNLTRNELALWKFAFKFIKKLLPKCRGDSNLLLGIVLRIFQRFQIFPTNLNSEELEVITKGIDLMKMITNPEENYLPQYLIAAHLSHEISTTVHPNPTPSPPVGNSPPLLPQKPTIVYGYVHWCLASFARTYSVIRNNVASLLTLTDFAEVCRLYGPIREEEAIDFKEVPFIHQIYMTDSYQGVYSSQTLNKIFNNLHYLLREGAPSHITRGQAISNADLKACINSGGSIEGAGISDPLCTAHILRTRAIINNDKSGDDDGWWTEWQHFADQFYTYVEKGVLDFERFIHSLHRSQKQENFQENALVWMIMQCNHLDSVKRILKEDLDRKLSANFGCFVPILYHFLAPIPAMPSNEPDLKECAGASLMYQILLALTTTSSPDQRKFLTEYLQRVQGGKIQNYRKTWDKAQENDKNQPFDYANLHNGNMKTWSFIWILSSITPQQISTSIVEYLNRPQELSSYSHFPCNPELTYKGRYIPIPLNPLAHLSIKCRCTIFESMEAIILNGKDSSEIAPSIVETYVRLLYMSPDPRKSFQNLLNAMSSPTLEPFKLQIFVEMLNFRLIRFIKFQSLVSEVITTIIPWFSKVIHPQIFSGLEVLALKLLPHWSNVRREKNVKPDQMNFGENINRCCIPLFARTLKTKPVHFYHRFADPKEFVKRFSQLSSAGSIPQATLVHFPSILQESIREVESSMVKDPNSTYPVVTRDRVREEFKNFKDQFTFSSNFEEKFVNRYNQNPYAKAYFLPVLWLIMKEQRNQELAYVNGATKVLNHFSPQEMSALTYNFVNFLLDESQLQGYPKSTTTDYKPALSPLVNETFDYLRKYIWNYNIFSFETMVMALLSRISDDPNAVLLLECLLFDEFFVLRVRELLNSTSTRDFWLEESPFVKNCDFYAKFPEKKIYLPVCYSNVVLRSIPMLDYVFGRLIEAGQKKTITKIINDYSKLYNLHHDNPSEFVQDTLCYYYDNPLMTPDMKIQFLRLLDSSNVIFTETFKAYLSDPSKDNSVFAATYFEKMISNTGHVISQGNIASVTSSKPTRTAFHAFEEFPTFTQCMVTGALLEILVLPLSASQISNHLIGNVFGSKMKAFPNVNAVALLLSQLPQQFHDVILEKSIQVVKSDKLLLGHEKEYTLDSFSLAFANNYSPNMSTSIDNEANKVLVLLQLFFHYSTVTNTCFIERLILACRPFQSVQQVFFVCKLVGPFIHRMRTNSQLVKNFLKLLFDCIKDIDGVLCELLWNRCSTEKDINSPLNLFDVVVDFLHHLSYSFEGDSNQYFGQELESVYRTFSPDLQWAFSHIFNKSARE
eukprot:TRINITY_DN6100_c0_g1_i1.p1 TRINITY_DN6100_c0_g1~~TRINITY_DN6100_c0_g1_i1.p1  ORF type:complete len:1488 (+),score=546.43 TRINITY_DN6100_c0_g1_i1:535-4464(+)